jgi:hypothetical protein
MKKVNLDQTIGNILNQIDREKIFIYLVDFIKDRISYLDEIILEESRYVKYETESYRLQKKEAAKRVKHSKLLKKKYILLLKVFQKFTQTFYKLEKDW